jgi:hypothetical protein
VESALIRGLALTKLTASFAGRLPSSSRALKPLLQIHDVAVGNSADHRALVATMGVGESRNTDAGMLIASRTFRTGSPTG